MTDHILVGVSWPYPNGEKHVGQIAGSYLPPDTFSRYQRMLGNQVLMVSGSDSHGTPLTIKAEEEGATPIEIVNKYHKLFIEGCIGMGLTFDLFTHTDTQNHWDTTHELFQRHLDQGYIYKETQQQLYDVDAGTFLTDRYVEGTCPFCGYAEARGDQCDNCGQLIDAVELGEPRSKITGSTNIDIRDTEQFFFDLGKLNEDLLDWVLDEKDHWRANVLNFTKSQLELRELRGRAITRDISWGVSIPVEGFDTKRIYVWYEAVIGYLSAAKEWAQLQDDPEAWRQWWDAEINAEARIYNFIGKDNIPFHTIFWPGMIIAYNKGGSRLNLPTDLPASEYLNLNGEQFSTSRGRVIGINSVLKQFQPDAWRYALTAVAPETSDVEFTWTDFQERVNNELVANWGNAVNRVIGFANKRFEGVVPTPGTFDETDTTLLADVKAGFTSVGELYEAAQLKAALVECRRLSQRVNQYLNEKEPWKVIDNDLERAATSVWVALQAIEWLKILWAPILPFSSQSIHEMLGFGGSLFGTQSTQMVSDARGVHQVLQYDHTDAIGVWEATDLPSGQAFGHIQPLFEKLDNEELERRVKAT
jgi:methionyl-tRNA synthetase